MKTFILIPFKNESARLTGKNMMLLPFTLEWIEKELEGLEEEVEVHTFGCISTDKRKGIESYGVEHVRLKFFEDRSHQGALENTLKKLGVKPEDRIIQLQLTQPKRKEGLLKEAIEALKEDSSKPIITATKVHIENRLVNDEGRRFFNQPEDLLLYDPPALYWRH